MLGGFVCFFVICFFFRCYIAYYHTHIEEDIECYHDTRGGSCFLAYSVPLFNLMSFASVHLSLAIE